MAEVAEILEGTPAHFCIFAADLAIMCTECSLQEAPEAMQKVLALLEEHLPDLGFGGYEGVELSDELTMAPSL